MRWLRVALVLLPATSLMVAPFGFGKARALPLFARKYSVPCTTCHIAFPRLNAFGMAFRQNGYRMPGAKGESPWESTLIPLSIVANVGVNLTTVKGPDSTGTSVRTTTSSFVQNAVEFHSAGTLSERVTFHVDQDFAGVGQGLESGQAWVQFDDLGKGPGANLKMGIFDADILYLAGSRRTTVAEYLTPVTFDGEGFELNGMESSWTYAVGLVNSGRTTGRSDQHTLNNLENVYAWLMRDTHGQLVTARVLMDRQDPRDSTKTASTHVQADVSAFLNHGHWVLIPDVTYEHFSDADLTQRDKAISGLLEALYLLDKDSRWVVTGRYEIRHLPKFSFQGVDVFPEEDDAAVVANLAYYVNPNAKIALEYSRAQDNVGGPKLDQLQAYVHIGY